MKVIAVIPARYESSRFHGKVLAKETGKYLVQHTYERALGAELVEDILIATDSEEVRAACEEFGARAVMTSVDHQSGTDRVAEAAAGVDADIVVNLQADEPEIEPANIDQAARLLLENPGADMATLVTEFESKQQVANPNIVKCVVDRQGRAIYFSRSVIPYSREDGGVGQASHYLWHMGIYAYRKSFLMEITQKAQTPLEKMEKLEQLRALEYGYTILTGKVEHVWEGIDTAQQYAEFVSRYGLKEGGRP